MIGPLWPYAQEALRVHARVKVYDGEVRSAKTVVSLIDFLRHLLANPGPAAFIGQSEESMRRNLEPPLRAILGSRLVWKKQEAHVAGRPVWVIGSATEGAAARIAGSTLRSLYVDEATTLPETAWNMGLSRLSLPGARAFATTNPDSPSHWLWQRWLKEASLVLTKLHGYSGTGVGDVARVRMRMQDNPYLPGAYKRFMRGQYSGVWAKRYLDGEWVAGSGRIWDAFTVERHVRDVPEWAKDAEQAVGLDYGTTHPFAAMHGLVLSSWATEDGVGRVHIGDEWVYDAGEVGHSLTDSQYSARLRFWIGENDYHPANVYVPPEAASFYAQLRLDGWDGVRDADNSVNDGLRVVANLLATDRLTISPRCVRLIEGIGRYSWDEKASKEHGKEQPLKEKDDEADALRYTVYSTERLWRQEYMERAA